jgi:hypothetical protein
MKEDDYVSTLILKLLDLIITNIVTLEQFQHKFCFLFCHIFKDYLLFVLKDI